MMKLKAFTLAELLIVLAILGVIATFTIPKILTAQKNQAYNAAYKEATSMVSGAYQAYKMDNAVTALTHDTDLMPYMQYVKVDTTSKIDHVPFGNAGAGYACDCANDPCVQLHSGAKLWLPYTKFGALTPGNYISFMFDPDGKLDGTANGPGKGVTIILFYDGRITSGDNRKASDTTYDYSGNPMNFGPDTRPDWYTGWN